MPKHTILLVSNALYSQHHNIYFELVLWMVTQLLFYPGKIKVIFVTRNEAGTLVNLGALHREGKMLDHTEMKYTPLILTSLRDFLQTALMIFANLNVSLITCHSITTEFNLLFIINFKNLIKFSTCLYNLAL